MAYNLKQKLFSITLLFCIIFSPTETASTFSHYNCTTIKKFSPKSTYQTNLTTLLSTLSSKALNHGYYNTSISTIDEKEGAIYGLFMCIGYTNNCGECVKNSTKILTSMCTLNKEAIIWSDECLVRYSDRSFFGTLEESPSWCVKGSMDYEGPLKGFNKMLNSLMLELVTEAILLLKKPVTQAIKASTGNSIKFVLKRAIFYEDKFLYGLAQCIPNLSNDNCMQCLNDAINYLQTSCAKRKIRGSVLYPSCVVRYDPYPYFEQPIVKSEENEEQSFKIFFHVLAPVMICSVAGFFFVYYLRRRRARKNLMYHRENFGEEITSEVNSLQFDFDMIRLATNKFSEDNKIGEGGFGDVYKGMFPNGYEIAVKRLIRNSSQGAVEFKNEVLLIAKLQHRNLVRLLGFCIQRNEKILIYEYMHNKSLDYYLFSPENHRKLTWHARYKIIRGIARGILYLHEDSHLKIIHCDLKPSNILLDDKMNAKISDFGLARIVAIDQMQGNTSIIAGTYGYMSPEYAMLGQFSVKSDVFSFGVIMLEIVSGKRNVDYNGVNSIEDLVSHFFKKLLEPVIDPHTIQRHPSAELNEFCQKKGLKLQFRDLWKVSEIVEVLIDEELVGSGKCGSKKEIAHNRAAKNALENMKKKIGISTSTKDDATEDLDSPPRCNGGLDAIEDLSSPSKCNGGPDATEDLGSPPKCNGGTDATEGSNKCNGGPDAPEDLSFLPKYNIGSDAIEHLGSSTKCNGGSDSNED